MPNYGPRIVTDGLVLYLDAANNKSYPGSGNTWVDLTGNNRNGTLLNSPTFSGNNSGNISFDGINQYCTVTEIGQLTRFSVESWFRPTSYPNNYACTVTTVFPGNNSTVNFKIGYENGSQMYGGFYNGTWRLSPGVNTSLNVWQQVVFTYDGSNLAIYSNGVSGGSNSYSGTPNSGGDGIRIGRRWDFTDYFAGNISITKIYNRALSPSEILENYNATKTRFGL